ncbi:hypothetical protein I6U48_26605 [Clostridium sp. PL3]|uniref:Uncharacterized protein n=1 Tax=Clostridium thailandense TaxID=2794346 RepID=A0A949WTP9_9CLOT|nr:hypothetical protein [Clostridium thailandense]MBV7276456.1 hypothetical protein [Clostridium thailandense]
MKVWAIKDYEIYEVEDASKSKLFYKTEEEAIKVALEMLNERISENVTYLEILQQMFAGQEELIKDYTIKRNNLLKKAKEDGITINYTIL